MYGNIQKVTNKQMYRNKYRTKFCEILVENSMFLMD